MWWLKLIVLRNLLAVVAAPITQHSKAIGAWITARLEPVHTAWKQLSKFKRNFVVGFIIAITLHFSHHSDWVSQMENLAMDSMMFISQDTPRMATGYGHQEPLAFTFIDIDEDTYRTWGEPFHIPRDKLLQLIRYAAEGGAKAIVVDIELSGASDKDMDLVKFYKDYGKEMPPLFLLRGFYPKSKSTGQKDYHIRPSILDSTASGNNIYWVHPTFKLSAYDQVVRYWHLLAVGCLNNQPAIVPAFQLLIDAYLRTAEDLPVVVDQLAKLTPQTCAEIEYAEKPLHGEIFYTGKKIELNREAHERIGERIIYTLPWKPRSTAELWYRPAHKITEVKRQPSNSAVKGRIVMIGASYSDSRDRYQTPLGEMPGALIIVNAIKSLHLFGQIEPPPFLIKWMLELALITLMSWSFARFSSLLGAMISGVVMIAILLPASFYLFKYGLWIDFAVPLLGIQCHQWLAEWEEKMANRYQHNTSTISESEEAR